jgi:hypothetical protein
VEFWKTHAPESAFPWSPGRAQIPNASFRWNGCPNSDGGSALLQAACGTMGHLSWLVYLFVELKTGRLDTSGLMYWMVS